MMDEKLLVFDVTKTGSASVNTPGTADSYSKPSFTMAPRTWVSSRPPGNLSGPLMHPTVIENCPESSTLCTKRRRQNREAQRRFRKRKEEQERNLQEKITDLEAKRDGLRERLDEKSAELFAVLRDKTTLEAQVQILRKHEQILVRLLQQPHGLLQSLMSHAADVKSIDINTGDITGRSLDSVLTPNNNK
ncbi:hypothetical protein BJX68DRAFT_251271 [Aspergillus pseudodeflectus]|uniref:BZIP domain-containing protein n=1 Tax=Aspergillus pseudodeflectus TaxID=176178 RepID=A0ABR4J759_9EURO